MTRCAPARELIPRDLIAKDLEEMNSRVAACCVTERQS